MPEITLQLATLPGLPADQQVDSPPGGFSFTLSRPSAAGAAFTLTIPIVNRGPESYAESQAQETWVSQRYPGLEMCFAGAWRTSDPALFSDITRDLNDQTQGPLLSARWLLAELRGRFVAQPPRAPNGCSLWSPRADVPISVRDAARTADLADYSRAIELAPGLAEAWLLRAARRQGEHEDYDGALADCTKAAELQPELAEAWAGQGWALVALGRGAEAIQPFERALALAGGRADARIALAYALEKAGELARAVDQLLLAAPPKAASPKRAGDGATHLTRARCLVGLGRTEDALQALAAAGRCQPANSSPWLERARLLRGLPDRQRDALAAAQKACSLALEWEVEPQLLLGGLLRGAGRAEEALTALDLLAVRAPGELRLYGERGLALADLGRFEQALADLDRYLAAASWPPAYVARAHCRWQARGDRLGALADLEIALESSPEDARALALQQTVLADCAEPTARRQVMAAAQPTSSGVCRPLGSSPKRQR